ncbi:MAG: hypothetical protein JWR42_1589 [Marmoricola sp.]|nr:hypothetical protein [Marmoricola sp.]
MEETWAQQWRSWQAEVRAWAALTSIAGVRTRCHVGVPAGERVVLPDEAALAALGAPDSSADAGAGVRADLVERALEHVENLGPAHVWVARTGPLGLGDVEVAWHAAARHALARHGLEPDRFLVLNRSGWLHVVSGQRQEWRRLRPRAPAARSAYPWDVAG